MRAEAFAEVSTYALAVRRQEAIRRRDFAMAAVIRDVLEARARERKRERERQKERADAG